MDRNELKEIDMIPDASFVSSVLIEVLLSRVVWLKY